MKRRNLSHCRTLLGVLIIIGLLCSLFLLLTANVSSLSGDTTRVRLDAAGTDEPGGVGGEPTSLEPGGEGSWQEMLNHEATHAPRLTPGTPEDLPNMPAPEPHEITDESAYPGPGASPLAPAAPAASGMQAAAAVAPHDDATLTHRIGISIGLICLGATVGAGIVVGIRNYRRRNRH